MKNQKLTKTKVNSLRILIPNATGPRNIGDQAMLEVLIDLIKGVHKDASITVHSTDPNMYKNGSYKTKHTLYSWSVYRETEITSRITNVSKLVIQYALLKLGIKSLRIDKGLDNLIRDYENADLIVFVGGGYLRSKKGIKQTLNLAMQLLLFRYAELFSARKIVAPISIGPFGYKWLEKIVANELKQMDLVAVREEYSYKILKKYKLKNIILSSDHALMIKKINKKRTESKLTFGFTIREWLKGEKHTNFENIFTETIHEFSQFTGAKIQPIVQVDASKYGEDDALTTKRVVAKLKSKNIYVLKTKTLHNVRDALGVYSTVDLLLGMRMHSNILAAIQGTPFVAISYEHKTEGIAKQLNMEKNCIKYENVDSKNLYKLLIDAYENKRDIKKQLLHSVKTIQDNETQKWNHYLSQD